MRKMVSTNFANDKTGVRSKSRTNRMLAGTGYILKDSKEITPTLKDPGLSSAGTATTFKSTKFVGAKRQADT
jgi:hypothetical protein